MATGYTNKIVDGITFDEFLMGCARAFGALITMRDEPGDAKVPDEIKPSSYHAEELIRAETKLAKTKAMRMPQFKAEALREYEDLLKYNEDGIEKANELRSKYSIMLNKVEAWIPPSDDHIGLKKFMAEQIRDSIKFDCDTDYYVKSNPTLLTGQQWKEKQLAAILKNIDYHSKKNIAEIERATGRTLWIQQLKATLTA